MAKIKVVPKYKNRNFQQKPDPQMEAYWKAFNAGRDHERKICIHYFITKLEELKKCEGVGEKTFNKIMDFVNKEWGE